MALASAYVWKQETLAVESFSKTVAGFWVCNDWWQAHDLPVTAEQVGDAVEGALDASAEGVPTPDRDEKLVGGLWRALGVKSWATFVKHAVDVQIARDSELVTVTPMKNRGAREGYTELINKAVILVSPTAGELGQAVLDAFELCE